MAYFPNTQKQRNSPLKPLKLLTVLSSKMDAVLTSLLALSITEQDKVISQTLSARSGSSSTKKVAKKAKATSGSDSESEPKPKREQTEGQKAWTSFIKHCQEVLQASSGEEKFSYKASMSIASALKKAEKMGSATDAEILEAYKTYRAENPLSESESEKAPATPKKASKKEAEPAKPVEPVVEEKPKKVSKKKAEEKPKVEEVATPAKKTAKKTAKAPKKSAPFKGPWTHDGTDYLRDDLVVRTLFGDFVGIYDPVTNEIDTSAMEPEADMA